PMMKNVVVGRDMRKTSPGLKDALCEGIIDAGGGVIDIGMVDTPFTYFAVNHLDCAGAVQTTASHNPPQYNGFKISKRKAKPVGEATGLADIRKIAATVDVRDRGSKTGHIEQRDLWNSYLEHVHGFLELPTGKNLKVTIDASNAMAGTMVPKVFGDVEGLEIDELYFDNSSGEFTHEPNPLVEANLVDLKNRVRENGSDFGICFDGDADRLVVVDELGETVGCDHLTAFLASWFLKREGASTIVYDLRSSKAVEEEIKAAGGTPLRSRVGHVFMKQALSETGGVFGGELSGHFYFRDNFFADSGAIALATVATAIAESGEPVSELIKPIARYTQSGEINFENEEKDLALEELEETYGERADVDDLDGITVDCFDSEGWWANVRKSNTEPLLRLNLEAKDEALKDKMVDEISVMLGTRVAH
ncbi:MAG: phosphomannomutase/phosphoglucomutase, partial [Planctomycetota bacterium]